MKNKVIKIIKLMCSLTLMMLICCNISYSEETETVYNVLNELPDGATQLRVVSGIPQVGVPDWTSVEINGKPNSNYTMTLQYVVKGSFKYDGTTVPVNVMLYDENFPCNGNSYIASFNPTQIIKDAGVYLDPTNPDKVFELTSSSFCNQYNNVTGKNIGKKDFVDSLKNKTVKYDFGNVKAYTRLIIKLKYKDSEVQEFNDISKYGIEYEVRLTANTVEAYSDKFEMISTVTKDNSTITYRWSPLLDTLKNNQYYTMPLNEKLYLGKPGAFDKYDGVEIERIFNNQSKFFTNDSVINGYLRNTDEMIRDMAKKRVQMRYGMSIDSIRRSTSYAYHVYAISSFDQFYNANYDKFVAEEIEKVIAEEYREGYVRTFRSALHDFMSKIDVQNFEGLSNESVDIDVKFLDYKSNASDKDKEIYKFEKVAKNTILNQATYNAKVKKYIDDKYKEVESLKFINETDSTDEYTSDDKYEKSTTYRLDCKVKVSFDTDGGTITSGKSSETIGYNKTLSSFPTVTKEENGYKYKTNTWLTEKGVKTTAVSDTTQFIKNTTLYPCWEDVSGYVKVDYYVDSSVVGTKTILKGTAVGEHIADPVLSGYTFMYWKLASGVKFNNTDIVNENTKVYAVFMTEQQPNITFQPIDGCDWTNQDVTASAVLYLPPKYINPTSQADWYINGSKVNFDLYHCNCHIGWQHDCKHTEYYTEYCSLSTMSSSCSNSSTVPCSSCSWYNSRYCSECGRYGPGIGSVSEDCGSCYYGYIYENGEFKFDENNNLIRCSECTNGYIYSTCQSCESAKSLYDSCGSCNGSHIGGYTCNGHGKSLSLSSAIVNSGNGGSSSESYLSRWGWTTATVYCSGEINPHYNKLINCSTHRYFNQLGVNSSSASYINDSIGSYTNSYTLITSGRHVISANASFLADTTRVVNDPRPSNSDYVVNTASCYGGPDLTNSSQIYKIDKENPISNITQSPEWTRNDVTYIVNFNDYNNLSGLSEVNVTQNGTGIYNRSFVSAESTYSDTFTKTLTSSGTYNTDTSCKDHAGNSNTMNATYRIDKINPTIEYGLPEETIIYNYQKDRYESKPDGSYFYLRVQDPGESTKSSGLSEVRYKIISGSDTLVLGNTLATDGTSTVMTHQEINTMKNGKYIKIDIPDEVRRKARYTYLLVYAIDVAGNVSYTSTEGIANDMLDRKEVPTEDGNKKIYHGPNEGNEVEDKSVPRIIPISYFFMNDGFKDEIDTPDGKTLNGTLEILRVYDVKWKNVFKGAVVDEFAVYRNSLNDTIGLGYKVDFRYNTIGYNTENGDKTNIDIEIYGKVGGIYKKLSIWQEQNGSMIDITSTCNSYKFVKGNNTINYEGDGSDLLLNSQAYTIYEDLDIASLYFNFYIPANAQFRDEMGNMINLSSDEIAIKFIIESYKYADTLNEIRYCINEDKFINWGGNGSTSYGISKKDNSIGNGQVFWYDIGNTALSDITGSRS